MRFWIWFSCSYLNAFAPTEPAPASPTLTAAATAASAKIRPLPAPPFPDSLAGRRRSTRHARELTHERAARSEHEPGAAVLGDVLAQHLPGPLVADVVVERPPRVRHLPLSVATAGRPEKGPLDAGAGGESAASEVRRPRLRAGAVAGAVAA